MPDTVIVNGEAHVTVVDPNYKDALPLTLHAVASIPARCMYRAGWCSNPGTVSLYLGDATTVLLCKQHAAEVVEHIVRQLAQ